MNEYMGIVHKVIAEGRHGPYAVAEVESLGLVTFSLRLPVWPKDASWPEGGSYVVLSGVVKKRAGWRANSARPYGPEDEKKQNQ